MVGESRIEPPLGCSAPHGSQPLPRAKNLPGFGNCRAMTTCEAGAGEKTSETVIQKIFDELTGPGGEGRIECSAKKIALIHHCPIKPRVRIGQTGIRELRRAICVQQQRRRRPIHQIR